MPFWRAVDDRWLATLLEDRLQFLERRRLVSYEIVRIGLDVLQRFPILVERYVVPVESAEMVIADDRQTVAAEEVGGRQDDLQTRCIRGEQRVNDLPQLVAAILRCLDVVCLVDHESQKRETSRYLLVGHLLKCIRQGHVGYQNNTILRSFPWWIPQKVEELLNLLGSRVAKVLGKMPLEKTFSR